MSELKVTDVAALFDDKTKMEEGAWFEWDIMSAKGTRVKIIAPNSKTHRNDRAKYLKQAIDLIPIKDQARLTKKGRVITEKVVRDEFPEIGEQMDLNIGASIILDWENMIVNGVNLPCTPENKRLLLDNVSAFNAFVYECVLSEGAFLQDFNQSELVAKKLPTTSSGAGSGGVTKSEPLPPKESAT